MDSPRPVSTASSSDENDDVFTGWATVLIPWGLNEQANARIEVTGDFSFNGADLENMTIKDIDWIEIETISGYRKGRIEGIDADDVRNDVFKAYFEAMPEHAQNQYIAGAELYNADEYGIIL